MSLRKSIQRWGSGTALSIFDQGILSLCNFAINIHLSRILLPEQYGLFAIVFSVYLLLLSLNQALVLEPLSVIGTTRYKRQQLAYFTMLARVQLSVSFYLSILLALFCAILYLIGNPIYLPLLSIVIAGPFISIFFLMRRFCYILFKPAVAFAGTLLYAVIMAIVYWWLYHNGTVTIFNVFLLFGAASLFAAILIGYFIYVRASFVHTKPVITRRAVLYKHWKLGKWLIGSYIIGWVSSSIYYPLVAVLNGLEATAAFKAIDNLLLPMQQAITALSLLIIPKVAENANRNLVYLRAVSIKLTFYFTLCVIAYLLCIYCFQQELMHLLYGADSIYQNYLWLLPFVGVTLVARAVSDLGIGVSLRVVKRFDILFKSSVANSILSLTLGLFLIMKYGVMGAGIGISIGAILQLLISSFYFKKIFGVVKS